MSAHSANKCQPGEYFGKFSKTFQAMFKKIPGNVIEQRFWEMLEKIPGNVQEDSVESKFRFLLFREMLFVFMKFWCYFATKQ